MVDLFAGDQPSLGDMLGSVRREVAMRERVYPRWVDLRKMTQEKADFELRTMKAVEELLEYALARRLTVARLREIVG
jgi:hypothetical protein